MDRSSDTSMNSDFATPSYPRDQFYDELRRKYILGNHIGVNLNCDASETSASSFETQHEMFHAERLAEPLDILIFHATTSQIAQRNRLNMGRFGHLVDGTGARVGEVRIRANSFGSTLIGPPWCLDHLSMDDNLHHGINFHESDFEEHRRASDLCEWLGQMFHNRNIQTRNEVGEVLTRPQATLQERMLSVESEDSEFEQYLPGRPHTASPEPVYKYRRYFKRKSVFRYQRNRHRWGEKIWRAFGLG